MIHQSSSLRSKCSHTKSLSAFWLRIHWSESKIGQSRGWLGEGRNTCSQTPWFWKTCLPTNGAHDWCSVVVLIDKCIKFDWTIPGITQVFNLHNVTEEGFWNFASLGEYLLVLTWLVCIRCYSEDTIFKRVHIWWLYYPLNSAKAFNIFQQLF